MTDEGGFTRDSIIARAKAIIMRPREEWPRIDSEPASIGQIFTGYVMPLAAIGPVAMLLGSQIFGYGAFGIRYRPGLVDSLSMAVASYVITLVGIMVMTVVVSFLGPKFGGTDDRLSAFKLVAYSMTAAALAGIFSLIPALSWLGIVGLYSLYLLHAGATPVMKVPAAKAMTFTIVTVLCVAVLYLVAGAIIGTIAGITGMRPAMPPMDPMANA